MKKLFVFCSAFWCALAIAGVNPYSIASAVSCNQDMDSGFYNAEFTKQFGPPFKTEGEAVWYKANGELYGSNIREVFVSSSKNYSFIGVVLEEKPETVIENIKTSRTVPTNVFLSSNGWVGADGRNIMWHEQKYTKIFCLGGIGRHKNT